jgi:hypothetical protein
MGDEHTVSLVAETNAATARAPSSVSEFLRRMGLRAWLRASVIAVVVGVVMAIPTRLLPNEFFTRMTPTRPQDYVFLVISAVLLGLNLAIVPLGSMVGRASAGGLGTVFAVGCPICNKIVITLIGVSGALTYFAPLQPVIAVGSIALLALTLRRAVSTNLGACIVGPPPSIGT